MLAPQDGQLFGLVLHLGDGPAVEGLEVRVEPRLGHVVTCVVGRVQCLGTLPRLLGDPLGQAALSGIGRALDAQMGDRVRFEAEGRVDLVVCLERAADRGMVAAAAAQLGPEVNGDNGLELREALLHEGLFMPGLSAEVVCDGGRAAKKAWLMSACPSRIWSSESHAR